jgi:pimeloyl-ACP methyl ester carboxylesterase
MSASPQATTLFALSLLLGCGKPDSTNRLMPTAPQRDGEAAQTSAVSLWASQIVDTTGPGAAYAMFIPTNWDESGRNLMVYVHGLVYPDSAIALPKIDSLRDSLGAKGFAVAYSSFSETGWAVKDGAERSHQLRGLFASRFGQPARTFIYGRSLGGLIAVMLAEKYPGQYAGAFAECGLVSGSPRGFSYLFDVRRLFDYFYPGILPGNALGVPEDWQPSPNDASLVQSAMAADMTGALAITKIDQTPLQFATPAQLRAAIIDVLTVHAFEVNDIILRSHGQPPVSSVTFTSSNTNPALRLGDELLESINANTLQFEAAPNAATFAEHYYDPSGDLRIPVMTLTTTRDPRLPSAMNDLVYQGRVDAAGKSDLLLRKQVVRFGHCNFTANERLLTFLQFVPWAESKEASAP